MQNYRNEVSTSDFINVIDRSATSLFFTNFLVDWTIRSMWIHFQRFGNVIDIFIPGKRSNQGKKFGFVKSKDVHNLEDMLARIRLVAVGADKLLVHEAHFRRNEIRQKINRAGEASGTKSADLPSPQRREDRNANYVR